ncbi:MAG: PfkB family carbohydrate kinase [Spirochaetaceae bacterium]
MKTVVTFGEIMIRLDMPDYRRIAQGMPGPVNTTFAGAEANVAVSLSYLGGESRFVTALPDNPLTDACLRTLTGLGVDTTGIVRTAAGRFGTYYVETGANQRPSSVIYDRELSSVSLTGTATYPWNDIFAGAGWFHITGITPALSSVAAEVSLFAVTEAKNRGLTVSCDLNFRKKLWRWEQGRSPGALAGATMRRLLPSVDLLIANEEDAASVLGIQAEETDIEAGVLAVSKYPDVARKIVTEFPTIRMVAITLRESFSATHNNWGAMLYDAETDTAYFAPREDGVYAPYEIRAIVDRVGGGDSFAAALIFALSTPELKAPEHAVAFAAAASCLAHSIPGDFNFSTRQEVEALMKGAASGRVLR